MTAFEPCVWLLDRTRSERALMERPIVEDDEACALARELPHRSGTTIDEAVIASLRASSQAAAPEPAEPHGAVPHRIPSLEEMTPEQREIDDHLRVIAEDAAAYARPGATSDHRDLYDEHGLPK